MFPGCPRRSKAHQLNLCVVLSPPCIGLRWVCAGVRPRVITNPTLQALVVASHGGCDPRARPQPLLAHASAATLVRTTRLRAFPNIWKRLVPTGSASRSESFGKPRLRHCPWWARSVQAAVCGNAACGLSHAQRSMSNLKVVRALCWEILGSRRSGRAYKRS